MSQPSFDHFAFEAPQPGVKYSGRGTRAVSAESRISFQDYGRMHIQRRVRAQERRLPTPKWAVTDELLRILLVTYLEERFYCHPPAGADLSLRLAIARQAAINYAPRKRELLDSWLDDYYRISHTNFGEIDDEQVIELFISLKEVNGQLPINAEIARNYLTKKKLKNLEVQIQNLDTDLVLTSKGHAEMIAAIVYLYYRLGWDSVTVAEELGLKSPHVRQVLARLHGTWRQSLSHLDEEPDASAPDTDCTPSATPLDALFGEE